MELLILVGLVLLGFIVLLIVIRSFLIIVPPNKVLVLAGRRTRDANGKSVGYRIIRGGRATYFPAIERAGWIDLTTIPLDLQIQNAYSKGGIPLTIHAVANVKINAHEPYLSNAIERFLDVKREQLTNIVRDTLEGNLRGIVATLTPEEINQDRLRFAEALIEEAEHDMGKLGMQLDTLKIQNVSDSSGYLDSIGRRKTADVLKEARVAEAERGAEAAEAEARSQQRSQVAQAVAQQAIIEEQNKLRVRQAELNAVAVAKENEAQVAGVRAKVQAEQALETDRIVLNQKRFEADVVAPARAQREAKLLEAQAAAAPIIEEGRAKAEAVRLMAEAFRNAGTEGERAYVLNMLPGIVAEFAKSVREVQIDKLSVIDSGNGSGYRSALTNLPAGIVSLMEQVENATGVNLLGALKTSANDDSKTVLSPVAND